MAGERPPAWLAEKAPQHLRREGVEVYSPHDDEPRHINVNLQKLEAHLSKVPLDDIAKEIISLTYGEMVEFSEAIKDADVDKILPDTVNSDVISKILHRWCVSQLKKDSRNEDSQQG